jgi:antitoxin CptB
MAETQQDRLKRMKMRAWRRGTKEMDLVLGPFADAYLDALSAPELEAFEAVLAEQDQDLMAWVFGQADPKPDLAPMLARIMAFATERMRKV